jgi:hypothetical protein
MTERLTEIDLNKEILADYPRFAEIYRASLEITAANPDIEDETFFQRLAERDISFLEIVAYLNFQAGVVWSPDRLAEQEQIKAQRVPDPVT